MNQEEKNKLNKRLIKAASSGDLQLVKLLLNQGADIIDALNYASYYGNIEIVKYLLEQGADIHAENDEALKLAAESGNLEIVKYLVENGANLYANKDYSLKRASKNNRVKIIQYFLFDCDMKISKETKNWLQKNKQYETLKLIEKKDLLLRLDKNLIQKDSIDKFNKKVKI